VVAWLFSKRSDHPGPDKNQCAQIRKPLLQFRVLGFRSDENRNVRVGVFQ